MFYHSEIDRRAQTRTDEVEIQLLHQSENSKTILWHEQGFIMRAGELQLFDHSELLPFEIVLDDLVYLGRFKRIDYFACWVSNPGSIAQADEIMSLRRASRLVSEFARDLMFYTQGILNWQRNHQYCSRCGSATTLIECGHGRRCNNASCAKVAYPKLDPAVIFSIVNNNGPESKILLGRKSIWDANRYSVIAGFVETGETLEDAVRREAYEETGVRVQQVEYVASQPWPFPDSLMLGFSAQTTDEQITLVDQELEKAAWFSADDIEQGLQSQSFQMPFDISIAWHLIDRWFQEQKGYSIAQIETPPGV
jgi:NAD+ diphosphatase